MRDFATEQTRLLSFNDNDDHIDRSSNIRISVVTKIDDSTSLLDAASCYIDNGEDEGNYERIMIISRWSLKYALIIIVMTCSMLLFFRFDAMSASSASASLAILTDTARKSTLLGSSELAVEQLPRQSSFQDHVIRTLEQLQKQIDGHIFFSHNNDGGIASSVTEMEFDAAAKVWALGSLQTPPLAVIQVATERDVQLALPVLTNLTLLSRSLLESNHTSQSNEDLEFAFRVRSGGHHKAGYSTIANGVVLSLARLNHAILNPPNASSATPDGTAIVRMGPALTVSDYVGTVLAKHGYGGVIGFCGSVAEGGFALGGGFGMQSRLYGLGADNIVKMNIVLADGSLLVVGESTDKDQSASMEDSLQRRELFWALRGSGGGNFGVVTEIDYRVHRASELVLLFQLTLSEPSTMAFALYQIGQLESTIPRNLVVMYDQLGHLNFFWTGRDDSEAASGNAYVEQLVPLLVPSNELTNTQSTIELVHVSFQWREMYSKGGSGKALWDQPIWAAGCWCGFLLPENNTLDNWNAIMALITTGVNESSPYLLPDIELWGGAIHDMAWNDTAFPYRKAIYNVGVLLLVPAAVANPEAVYQENAAKIDQWWPKVDEYLSGSYVNYPMTSLVGNKDYARIYWGDNLPRLSKVKKQVDPDNVFRFPLNIPIH